MSKKIVLLVCISVFLASSVIPIPSIMAEEGETIVYVDPPTIHVVPGGTFTVSVCVINVTDLWAWQIELYFDNLILNCTADTIWYSADHVFADEDFASVTPVIRKDEGGWCIMFGSALMSPAPPFTGNGILCQINFTVVASGSSALTFCPVDTLLLDFDLNDIPFQARDGYITGLVPHDVAIVSVTSSATEVFTGQIVNLNIVSKNVGTTTETFNVTACYNSHVIGTETLTDIAPSEETTLQFVWNTSSVPHGIYVVKVLASVVPGETIIANNIFVDSTVTIKPAYDLSVSVDVPWHFTAGKSSLLKASVSNVGWKPVETNIELQLFIDENIVNDTVLARLDPGGSMEITYLWTPTVEGTYTVKAYAPPILGEEVTVNNAANKTVVVSPPEMPTIRVEPWRDYVRVGEFVRVHVHVYDVTDLYAWQIKLHYNPEVLEFRNIWLPDDHVFAGMDYVTTPRKVGENYVMYGASLIGAQSTFDGSGILCKIDFKAKAMYHSSLQLDDADTFLLDSALNKVSVKRANSDAWVYGDTIEITNVETSRTEVYAGWIIEVNVTVRNNGYIPQTFSVTAYFASEVKVTKKVYDLPPAEETTLIFYMDTSPLTPYVDYAIWAEATIVIGETWAYNNFFFEWGFWGTILTGGPGVVTTRIVPDVNGDTKVDVRDVAIAAIAFGSCPEHPRWNLLADMNQDDKVDMKDLALVACNFGKTYE